MESKLPRLCVYPAAPESLSPAKQLPSARVKLAGLPWAGVSLCNPHRDGLEPGCELVEVSLCWDPPVLGNSSHCEAAGLDLAPSAKGSGQMAALSSSPSLVMAH